MPYTHHCTSSLEKHFIVVDWDQRGAGKSFDPEIPRESMNLEQMLADTHELIERLKSRFNKEKIFLTGHSWGSVLGLYTAHRHPEDLHAFVGMGQVVSMQKGEAYTYGYTVRKAKEAGDKPAMGMLEKIGPPPYKGGFQSLWIQRAYLLEYGGSLRGVTLEDLEKIRSESPYYTVADRENYMKAFTTTCALMWDDLEGVDFFEDVAEVKVPVYFFTGRHDYQAPFELLEQYVEKLKAPHKEIVWFDKSAHMPNLEEPELFQERMISAVLANANIE
jgi:pimeloyl-ACP methyl ester carboxylesterase